MTKRFCELCARVIRDIENFALVAVSKPSREPNFNYMAGLEICKDCRTEVLEFISKKQATTGADK